MTKIQIQTILVPTDFTENAACAYAYAETLARTLGAKILIAHVTEPFVYAVGPGQIAIGWEEMQSEIQENVKTRLQELTAKFGDTTDVETIYRQGTPFVELVRLARDRKVDMIVMATHGHTGFKHLLLGSTAEKVVRKAGCPVLTVHPGDRSFMLP